MINKIQGKLVLCKKQLDQIERQKKDCKACNGKGFIKVIKKVFEQEMSFGCLCDCQKINDLTYLDISEKITLLNNMAISIKSNIPPTYREGCYYSSIDKRIKEFYQSDNLFCWVHGGVGTGKTYALNALVINQIANAVKYKSEIVKEVDFSYKTNIKKSIYIDDIGISENENRNQGLSDLYYKLIDYKRENNQKIVFTSNYSLSEWLNYLSKFNQDNAIRIESRLSNLTDVIELSGNDRRKHV